jgi:hypothetical protein
MWLSWIRDKILPGSSRADWFSILRMPDMSIGILLLVLTVLLFTVALPAWPYNRGWDSRPSISFGLLALTILMLLGTGRL